MNIFGNILDVHHSNSFYGSICIEKDKICDIQRLGNVRSEASWIVPGLVDSHVHIESSMLTPSLFSKLVVPCGTVAVVGDPHEIGNVLGCPGVLFMMEDAKNTPLKCFFGAPSCVPATSFEGNGGIISAQDIDFLFANGAVALSEVMNFPGVIHADKQVMVKIDVAKRWNKPIDGHAPGLTGRDLQRYVSAGISTDHECSSLAEAEEKIALGMRIQIRQGSAARNFSQLHPLFSRFPDHIMLCTDDAHPDEILEFGHIDKIVRLALSQGYSIFEVYRAALINPVAHYRLPVGMLRVGDFADFLVLSSDLTRFEVLQTYIDGKLCAEHKRVCFETTTASSPNFFILPGLQPEAFQYKMPHGHSRVNVIQVQDGELCTQKYVWAPVLGVDRAILPSPQEDIVKLAVINRYGTGAIQIGFVKGLGISRGGFGGTIAHDSHNIIVAGATDDDLWAVYELLAASGGGIAACCGDAAEVLPLPIAGLMSSMEGSEVALRYKLLQSMVQQQCGSTLQAPFMTLSFLSLLVIPSLKLGDRGLFDVDQFEFIGLTC